MTENVNHVSAINEAANSILKHKVDSLQVIPAVALKLLRLTNDATTNVADLSQLIETEPALAAKILRNVNSAAFALSHKITSIKRAVNILGFSAVRQLALNQLFYNKLIAHKENREFDQLFFWQHCLFVASLSRAIAIALKHKDPDLIYSAGLMHDIGKIVFETHGKVNYSDFILACRNDEQSTVKGEHDFFGLNHAEMGYVFCQQWDIPERIGAIVYCHHDMPDNDSPFAEYKGDIAIVSFANYIAWLQGIGSIQVNNLPELHSDVSNNLNIEKLNIESLLNKVDQEMQGTRGFYGIQFPSLNKLRASLVETTLLLSHQNKPNEETNNQPGKIFLRSLIAPHQSLDPNELVPGTLAAIHGDLGFDRLFMLKINTKQRNLEIAYSWPEALNENTRHNFNVKIDILPASILKSLRDRRAIIITAEQEQNKMILEQFKVQQFLIVPVLSHNRLVALVYVDNYHNHCPISSACIDQITPIVHELGVALANAKRFELEKKRAEHDSLTGLRNKRMMVEFLTETFQSNNDKLPHIAVGFIDIDFFKKFNDSCGHQAGDDVLKIVAQIMRTLTRPSDFIGRYGGEEFVFVLHGTDAKGANCYAERIRQEIERKGKILSQRFKGHALTVSIGVSMYKQSFTSFGEIIEAADGAMYTAKHNGRNCIVVV
ncbi:MAG: HDOD domain-containing protein [Methylococcaceae bacterium]